MELSDFKSESSNPKDITTVTTDCEASVSALNNESRLTEWNISDIPKHQNTCITQTSDDVSENNKSKDCDILTIDEYEMDSTNSPLIFTNVTESQTKNKVPNITALNEDPNSNTTVIDSDQENTLTFSVDEFEIDEKKKTQDNFNKNTKYEINEREFFANSLIELSRSSWKSHAQCQHFTKGCLWSPDGTCVLVPVNLDGMHLIELPLDLYKQESVSVNRNVNLLQSAVQVKEGGTVYDCAWYPFMNSSAPETCCWIASRQHEPIHMWDAFEGGLRCTYRGYDEVDEVAAAISLSFSSNGEKVIAGYKKSIKIFNTNIPGRDCDSIPVKQAVSCFAINSTATTIITTGSWNGFINLYDTRFPKLGPLTTLGGHCAGITYLQYTGDGEILLSGARKDNYLNLWDMRNYSKPMQKLQRNVTTNQRIYFDLSPKNEWLASGDTNGLLRVWDLKDEFQNIEIPLHEDCCNGVSFHPSLPILATSSGQCHFEEGNANHDKESVLKESVVDYENSMVLWWFGKCY